MSNINPEIVKLIGVLTAVFPDHLDNDGIRIYARLLSEVPLPVLRTAIEQCANDCTFFPKPAEIRERVAQIQTPARATAADAWNDVMIAIRQIGFYGQPTFENPITAKVIFSLDWQALCSSENTIADRAHFMKMYDSMVEREKSEAKLLPITKALREELTRERRQIQGATTDAPVERVG